MPRPFHTSDTTAPVASRGHGAQAIFALKPLLPALGDRVTMTNQPMPKPTCHGIYSGLRSGWNLLLEGSSTGRMTPTSFLIFPPARNILLHSVRGAIPTSNGYTPRPSLERRKPLFCLLPRP